MKLKKPREEAGAWDLSACEALMEELWALRSAMLANETRLSPALHGVSRSHLPSALNLTHYLALRRFDLRSLQERLAALGLSSLGRAETHVLANLDKVLGILHQLTHREWAPRSREEPNGYKRGRALLEQHAQALFGPPPRARAVRVMVTLPGHAAQDDGLITGLVHSGMDIARINCAHDDAATWRAMADRVRQAAEAAGRPVKILMDLGGPKLRTGPIAPGPSVFKLKPQRDVLGRVTAPALLVLHATGTAAPATPWSSGVPCLQAPAPWLAPLQPGDRIVLTDAREAERELTVQARHPDGVLLRTDQTAYLTPDTVLRVNGHGKHSAPRKCRLDGIPTLPGQLHLRRGDYLRVVADGVGHDAVRDGEGRTVQVATVACTLPQALAQVREGDPIWFDDGKIGGVVRSATRHELAVQITHARVEGERLAADKGINLPGTRLDLPALTEQDLTDLPEVAQIADIVGLSFAQSATDVHQLRQHLSALGAPHLGVILKIETSLGFEQLPELLMAALTCPAAGVMIARGDLAVECGFERLAEVQEEILWACEAAHLPVVWATQVLENQAKTGLPSRAEISDAAMGVRAECVMLNKGPHILEAVHTLDDILRRMQAHQSKKRPLLRALKSWAPPPASAPLRA